MSSSANNAQRITELINSPLNDEQRLQVLISLTSSLAQDLSRLRNQLNLEEQA